MFEGLEKFIDLGGTVVVAGMAFWCMVQILKFKKNQSNGTNKDILAELQLMNSNHLNEICKVMERGNKELIDTIHSDNIKIIELLGRIDGRLDR